MLERKNKKKIKKLNIFSKAKQKKKNKKQEKDGGLETLITFFAKPGPTSQDCNVGKENMHAFQSWYQRPKMRIGRSNGLL